MRLIDEQYTKTPFYGSRRMAWQLRQWGYAVNRKRVQRLMQKMGIAAIYPGPNTSKPHPAHRIYPYLLRGLAIERLNQVWSTDITYIRMVHGFMYLVAVMDWYSRYVLSWRLSNTLEADFCIEALEDALAIGTPEIFNTDRAPVRAFITSGGNTSPFPVEVGTVQHLTQRPKGQWGQSVM